MHRQKHTSQYKKLSNLLTLKLYTMKRLLLLSIVSLFAFHFSLSAQEIVGSTRTLESAQKQHQEKLKQKGVMELKGSCKAQNTRQGRQGVKDAAAKLYAEACVSQMKSRAKADKKAGYSESELKEFDSFLASYVVRLQGEIGDELVLSYMVRDKVKGGDEYRGFFTLDEETASRVRMHALEQMPQESVEAKKCFLLASRYISETVSVKTK